MGPLVGRAYDGVLAFPRHTCVFSFPVPSCSGLDLGVPPLWLLLLTVESGCYFSSSSCSRPTSPLQRVSPEPQALQPAHSAAQVVAHDLFLDSENYTVLPTLCL